MAFLFNEVIVIPKKPLKACKYLGCPRLTEDKYCNEHKEFNIKERDTVTERAYNSKWRSSRNRFLKANPLCVRCKAEGRLVKATVVDHIKPHRGDKKLSIPGLGFDGLIGYSPIAMAKNEVGWQ